MSVMAEGQQRVGSVWAPGGAEGDPAVGGTYAKGPVASGLRYAKGPVGCRGWAGGSGHTRCRISHAPYRDRAEGGLDVRRRGWVDCDQYLGGDDRVPLRLPSGFLQGGIH